METLTPIELLETGVAKVKEQNESRKNLVLSKPSAHTLQECFAELKFGRPAEDQKYLQSLIDDLNS